MTGRRRDRYPCGARSHSRCTGPADRRRCPTWAMSMRSCRPSRGRSDQRARHRDRTCWPRPGMSYWSRTSSRTPTRWAARWRSGLGLARRGKPVAVSFAEPHDIPESLSAPARRPSGRPAGEAAGQPGVAGQPGRRLGRTPRLAWPGCWTPPGRRLVIDHHASNTRFGQHHYVDASAEATVVLVARHPRPTRHRHRSGDRREPVRGLATDTAHFRNADSECAPARRPADRCRRPARRT